MGRPLRPYRPYACFDGPRYSRKAEQGLDKENGDPHARKNTVCFVSLSSALVAFCTEQPYLKKKGAALQRSTKPTDTAARC